MISAPLQEICFSRGKPHIIPVVSFLVFLDGKYRGVSVKKSWNWLVNGEKGKREKEREREKERDRSREILKVLIQITMTEGSCFSSWECNHKILRKINEQNDERNCQYRVLVCMQQNRKRWLKVTAWACESIVITPSFSPEERKVLHTRKLSWILNEQVLNWVFRRLWVCFFFLACLASFLVKIIQSLPLYAIKQ